MATSRAEQVEVLVKRLVDIDAYFSYERNGIGCARLFSDVFRNEHRYNQSAKDWFRYSSGVWELDTEGLSARADLKLLGDALVKYEGILEIDSNAKNEYHKHVGKWLESSFRNTVLGDAKDQNYIRRDDLDTNPYLFNCQNCTLSLREFEKDKPKRMEHDPSRLLSKIAGVKYDENAKCPRFDRFIEEVTKKNKGKARYLQKFLGLALIGDVPEDKFLNIYGSTTRNGKTTLTETIKFVFGTYAISVNPETLTKTQPDSRRASGDIARLAGVRLAVSSEAPRNMALDSALIKKLTGNNTITARHLMEREFDFKPQFTLVMESNYLPQVSDSTVFSSDRIVVCEFNRYFSDKERDKQLKKTLMKEGSGILNWLIEGYQLYLKEGLELPASMKRETKKYEEDSDQVKVFIKDKLQKAKPNDRNKCMAAGVAYKAYTEWAAKCEREPIEKAQFFDELKTKKLFKDKGTIDGKTVRNVIPGYNGFVKTDKSFKEVGEQEETA